MSEVVELSRLRGILEKGGQARSSLPGMALIAFAICDTLASLAGHGLFRPLFAMLLSSPDQALVLAALTLTAQAAIAWLGIANLRRSGVAALIGRRNLLAIAGAPAGLDEPLGRIWAGCAAGLALAALVASGPGRSVAGDDSTWLMLLLFPPIVGAAYAALVARAWEAHQRLDDSSGLRGAGVGLLPLVIDVLFVPGVGEVPVPDWHATGAAILLALIIGAIATLLGPLTKQRLVVKAGDLGAAPPTVRYNPLATAARAQRFLAFDRDVAQLLVLTRAELAEEWVLVDSADEQLDLPIYDRSLLILNLSHLSAALLQPIKVTDASSNVALNMDVGQLMVSARLTPGSTFNRRAMDAAENLLVQNADLHGMLTRAASRALYKVLMLRLEAGQFGSIAQEVRETLGLCNDVPDAARFLRGAAEADTERLVEYTAARLQGAMTDVEVYRTRLAERADRFQRLKEVASLAGADFEATWLAELAAEIDGAGAESQRAGAAHVDHAQRVMELFGLKLSKASTTLIGEAQECAERLAKVREELKTLAEAAEARHEEALRIETQHALDLEMTVVGTGGLSRDEKRHIIGRRMATHLPRGRDRLTDQAPPTPLSVRYESQSEEDDDEVT